MQGVLWKRFEVEVDESGRGVPQSRGGVECVPRPGVCGEGGRLVWVWWDGGVGRRWDREWGTGGYHQSMVGITKTWI